MRETIKNNLQSKLGNLPNAPGVYQFKDASGKVIYVGKAKILKNRVRQYFQARPGQAKTEAMVAKIADLEIIKTDNEIEALILEFNLIKQLKPRYNVLLKDDKTYPYIVITNEPFPRVFPTRRKRNDGSRYFGPYTDVKTMRFALKSIRDIFTIRSCNLNLNEETIKEGKFKVCLDYHIKKCEGPCVGLQTQKDYNEMIDQVAKLLNGKTATLEKELRLKMEEYSANMMFEQAARARDKMEALSVYNSRQKMAGEEIIDRDVFAVVSEDNDACGMNLKIRDGRVIGKSHFYFGNVLEKPKEDILENLVTNYYLKSDFIPDEIFFPFEMENTESLEKWLTEKKKQKVEIIVPKIGEKAKLVHMVESNATLMLNELKLAKMKREYIAPSVESLKRDLRLNRLPRHIECFDISHIQGTDTVASMVVFRDAKPKKSEYRKYKIRSVTNETGEPDDFLSMREVIHRRFRRLREEGSEFPDLVVIDGGKGQLSSAVSVFNDMNIEIANPNGESVEEKQKAPNIIGLAKRLEEVFMPNDPDPHTVPKTSSGLKLLQRVRDEAHRFAIEFHRSLRSKRTIVSELNEIKGISDASAKKLLTKYGSFEGVKEAVLSNEEEFALDMGKRVTGALVKYFFEADNDEEGDMESKTKNEPAKDSDISDNTDIS
ncbi:MAG: excinuclease ABC subunit UvrC [Bacteroidetes bacterium]|nr:excinuclease ABC subunit UvrC [Bacteroidota bacterium]